MGKRKKEIMKKIIYTLRSVRCFFQTLFLGYNYRDMWSLDHHLAKIIVKRLKYFRKTLKYGYPSELNSIEEWNQIVDKMIKAFDNIINEWGYEIIEEDDKYYRETEEGLFFFQNTSGTYGIKK